MLPARSFIPLAAFLAVAALLAIGLQNDPHKIPSMLIDKPTPDFALTSLTGDDNGFSHHDLKGNVSLLNVFASWCPGCRVEHPMLMQLAARGDVPIYGLNWKDRQADSKRWLAKNQNPYARVGLDESGRVGIDLGVTGVPETFVIDRTGRIRYRYPGPITQEVWQEHFEPLLKDLRGLQ
ncbi:MAG TPA: DsbE family thiol:disulfide interchange protein [Acidobacteriaceae bacterium]|nr:DsbE family thiol:disulfide interchange protein [Acidobacteriaceae bacterium]